MHEARRARCFINRRNTRRLIKTKLLIPLRIAASGSELMYQSSPGQRPWLTLLALDTSPQAHPQWPRHMPLTHLFIPLHILQLSILPLCSPTSSCLCEYCKNLEFRRSRLEFMFPFCGSSTKDYFSIIPST